MESALFIIGVLVVFAVGYVVHKKRDRNIPQPPTSPTPEKRERPGKRK